jgi:hypothetical protein
MTVSALIVLAGLGLPSASFAGDYRFHYNSAWFGNPANHLRFAKQMGYRHVVVTGFPSSFEKYRNDPNAQGMRFLVETPEYAVLPTERGLELTRKYTPEEIATWERYYVWKSRDPFPNNIATGWFFAKTNFSATLDLQQQAVIDEMVDRVMRRIREMEDPAKGFTFGGVWWDVADLRGDFWNKNQEEGGHPVGLEEWTGKDSGLLHPGITHQYATYTEGRAAFYRQLFARIRREYPRSKLIMEPYKPYEDWIQKVEKRPDRQELMPDMLEQESYGTQFVDDPRIFASGLITPDRMSSATPDHEGEYENRLMAARAALKGAWFNWSGRFGGTGNMPPYQDIIEVPARLQLIRVLPNWDNLVQVPLKSRRWDGRTYQSPNSQADGDVIASRHPETRKLFVVFLNSKGRVRLRPGEKIQSVQRVDKTFCESGDGAADVALDKGTLALRDVFKTGQGYVVTLGIR